MGTHLHLVGGVCQPLTWDATVLCVLQGNMDPGVLFGSKDVIEARVLDTIKRAKSQGVRHIMNLGHGVLPGTPEENVAHYFEVARTAHERL
jgi:uroporphyrinogen decarboxylase